MPTSMKAILESASPGAIKLMAEIMAAPSSNPRKSEDENMPPRRPEPSDTADAMSLPNSRHVTMKNVRSVSSAYWIAPWPEPSTCGEPKASTLKAAPPMAGRIQIGKRRSACSAHVTERMVRIENPAAATPTMAKSR